MTETTITIIIGLLIPLLGTMVGSAFVFFMKDEMSDRLQKSPAARIGIEMMAPSGMF